MTRSGKYERTAAHRAQSAAVMRAVNARRDREVSVRGGTTACSHLYLCSCGREMRGPTAFGHAKRMGHSPVVRIDSTTHQPIEESA